MIISYCIAAMYIPIFEPKKLLKEVQLYVAYSYM